MSTQRTAANSVANSVANSLPIHELVSWPPLLAATLLALNDHVLKAEFAAWWTGKLSDVAGLFYFPLFLTASVRLAVALLRTFSGRRFEVPALRSWHLTVAGLATALVFSVINLSATAMAYWSQLLSTLLPSVGTSDATDLFALPAVLAALWWGRRFIAAADVAAADVAAPTSASNVMGVLLPVVAALLCVLSPNSASAQTATSAGVDISAQTTPLPLTTYTGGHPSPARAQRELVSNGILLNPLGPALGLLGAAAGLDSLLLNLRVHHQITPRISATVVAQYGQTRFLFRYQSFGIKAGPRISLSGAGLRGWYVLPMVLLGWGSVRNRFDAVLASGFLTGAGVSGGYTWNWHWLMLEMGAGLYYSTLAGGGSDGGSDGGIKPTLNTSIGVCW